MLVDKRAEVFWPLKCGAAFEHYFHERSRFSRVHAAKINRHRQCRHLIFGHVAADKPAHKFGDFLRRKPAAVAFFGDDGNWVHGSLENNLTAKTDAESEGADINR